MKNENGQEKSAILKGSTKYRDIDTGEILEAFEEGRNLELVSVKMPVLKTSNEDGTKTNILTTPEDLELRGFGDVKDELDCLTGELTQKVENVLLTGDEVISLWSTTSAEHLRFFIQYEEVKEASCICNKFINDQTQSGSNSNFESIASIGTGFTIVISKNKLNEENINGFKQWLKDNSVSIVYQLKQEVNKTVVLNILDQDNQPQERMKIYPSGYINTSSSTIPPILELKGIVHSNKLNMTTTNGVYTNNVQSLTNPVLDGIICRDGTVVRDSYDVESGLYTKRVFRFTIDEDFIERYRSKWDSNSDTTYFEPYLSQNVTNLPKSINSDIGIANNITYYSNANINRVCVTNNGHLYIHLLKEQLTSYDINGLIDWIKRNGAIEMAYAMDIPQIIHIQPNMNPYISTRPYQGEINSQGNILESSYLDYTSEQSIISPKPLGNGDVLRWEQGSQCYVYENEKDYIPLTDYNQRIGTVLDLEEEDGEQFVENLDGGEIVVDVPFKEKAVYERHLVLNEDTVIYPTMDKLDPDCGVEVDYICGATWQNPNDLSDIRHLGTLRDDGQYDVTIRRSGDDEIRLFDGITHISLDGDGLNPSEFELTYFNKGGAELGKYGDTSHTLENCVLDSKLETGMVYGDTQFNSVHKLMYANNALECVYENNKYIYRLKSGTVLYSANIMMLDLNKALVNGEQYRIDVNVEQCPSDLAIAITANNEDSFANVIANSKVYSGRTGVGLHSTLITVPSSGYKNLFIRLEATGTDSTVFSGIKVTRVSTNEVICNHTLISTIVNGFTTCGINLVPKHFEWGRIDSSNGNLIDSTTRHRSEFIPIKLNQKYHVLIESDTDDYFIRELVIYDKNKTRKAQWGDYLKSSIYTSTIDGYIRFAVMRRINNVEVPAEFGAYRVHIVPSEVEVPYEPYKGITYNLPLPITLNKVGDVADTYDVVSGVETRNVTELTFNGSENWDAIFNSSSSVFKLTLSSIKANSPLLIKNGLVDGITSIAFKNNVLTIITTTEFASISVNNFKNKLKDNPVTIYAQLVNAQTIQHTLIPSTVETMQEPTFILPQPLRSVPNGICDRLYWDENKGHYCIEKRVEKFVPRSTYKYTIGSATNNAYTEILFENLNPMYLPIQHNVGLCCLVPSFYIGTSDQVKIGEGYKSNAYYITYLFKNERLGLTGSESISEKRRIIDNYFNSNDIVSYYVLATSQIIDLPYLNKKLTLPTQPNTLPIGYKVEYPKANPQLGLTIPYKQLNNPKQPQNIDFKMDIADYVLTWDDVKEARQYNIILNDKTIATVKEPQWNSGEEMYGYILVEAQNELGENLSEELYIKTVPNAPAQLTVAHNPMTNYYDFEISFIKTSAIAEYYTVQYRVDGGEWVIKNIPSEEIDPNSKVLWDFSVFEINKQIEVWATATNEIGTNDILPIATYYMSPTPQWTYRINTKELFVRWIDESPYDTQYKLRYQYKSDGIYRYAYFEGDKQEIGKLYEALIPLAQDEEITIALCVISEKENLYTKPIKASKELDPNIKPPKNFNYRWLARGLIEFYWEDNYDVDVQYEAIVEHRLSGETTWTQDTRLFDSTDVAGTGTIYRLQYQLTDLEEIRVKVRMKWAMNETEWSESLTTVFIPVEGNPPQWIRRTQTKDGLLVEWEAQQYVDSYHVYVMSNGEELQHLETKDNFVLVDIDYSNTIDIEIYEVSRFTGGIEANPSDSMHFRPTMDKQELIGNFYTPDLLRYELEIDTVQKDQKARTEIHDINVTPNTKSKDPLDISISSPFVITYHPLQLDVHQSGSKSYGQTELHIKTLDVKSRDVVEVLTFERVTDQYGVDFTVYTPSASKYPITLEVNRVRIVCFGDSLTSGHPGFWAETGTGDPQHCYEYWLDRRLKGQYEIINKGYGSDTTDRMLARFDRDVLSNNPQYCIIQGGTNDLYWAMAESMGDQEALNMKLQVMKDNIMEMVKRCWDNNIIPIVGNLIPRTGATGIYKTALYDFNAWIIQWCTQKAGEGYNIFYVDLFNAGKEAVPPTPIEDPTNPGAMNPIYDGDALFDEFGNIIKQGRGIHLNKEGYRIWAEAIPLSIFKTYDSGLRMYKNVQCTDEDDYDDSDKQNPFYTMSVDNVRRSKTKTVVRYVKNIGKTQVLFAMYASDEYNMSIEFIGSNGEKGQYCNGLLAPNMVAKVTMEINLDNKDSKATFNLHLAAREYNQS